MKTLSEARGLPDMQGQGDARSIPLEKAGIKGMLLPMIIFDRSKGQQHITAKISIFTSLPAGKRSAPISTFAGVLNKYSGKMLTTETILEMLGQTRGEERGFLEVEFVYFMEKKSPASQITAPLGYACKFYAELADKFDLTLEAEVPVMTLCPHSKELSGCGAHNQRSTVTIKAKGGIWLDDLIRFAEKAASSEIYPVLKSEDEKIIAERAYANPKLAEDVVRDVTKMMKNDKRIKWFRVSSENFDSNRSHNVYAETSSGNN